MNKNKWYLYINKNNIYEFFFKKQNYIHIINA